MFFYILYNNVPTDTDYNSKRICRNFMFSLALYVVVFVVLLNVSIYTGPGVMDALKMALIVIAIFDAATIAYIDRNHDGVTPCLRHACRR